MNAERFRQVVVRSGEEPGESVGFLPARGQHQDRDGRPLSDQLARPDPGHAGQGDVHDHKVGLETRQAIEGILGSDEPTYLESLPVERRDQRSHDGVLVLDEDEAAPRRAHRLLHTSTLRGTLAAVRAEFPACLPPFGPWLAPC